MRAAALALLLTGCSPAILMTHVQRQTFETYTDDALALQYLYAVAAFEQATDTTVEDPLLWMIYRRITVRWDHDGVECPDPGYSGCTTMTHDGRYIVDVFVRGCLPMNSYTHELMHVLSMEILGEIDPNHTDKRIWPIDPGDPTPNPYSAYWTATAAGIMAGLCD